MINVLTGMNELLVRCGFNLTLLVLGSLDNDLPSTVSACANVRAQINECTNPSKKSSSLVVYGIDVYENDISTLVPQKMVNDTIVNILFE